HPTAAVAAEVQAVFPSDRQTVPDPRQSTGRRVALALPDCGTDPAGCDEIRLVNELDGFSVNPRLAIRFSGPIDLASLTRAGAFILPLSAEPLPSPVGLTQLVWDGPTHTLYARPERVLLQGRRYALVLTTKIFDDGGQPLAPAPSAPLVAEAAYGVSAQGVVFQRLKPLGLARRDVAAVSVFTTQSVTVGLEQMRAVIETGPGPELRFALGAGGARSAYARVELDGLELRRQASTDPAAPLEESARLPLPLVSPTDVRTIAFGRFTARSFLTADRVIPATATRAEAPARQGREDVDVTVYLPAGTTPPDGWPVAIFGHGFGNDRHVVPMAVAGTMARFGFATVAINVVGHGGGADGTLTVLRTGREPITLPAGGRGVDLDGDGRIGSTEGVGTRVGSPLALISTRDGLRQTAADLMQLVRAIRHGVDVDDDGRVDLDRERITYFGQSFGGIYGTLLMAVDPLVRVGVLNVPGGPIVEIARQSPSFRGLVMDQLKQRQPPLMNGEQDFTESIPLPGEAPVREPAAGALDIQAYFDRAEWLGQSGNPVAFAPYLKQAPLLGLGAKAVLYQWAVGDRTVPNPTTAALLRAGLLQPASSLYRHDLAGLSDRFKNPHGFLVWTAFPEAHAIGLAAQEQVARFFLSGGRMIESVIPQFEIGAELPAGR
ncbi:MAG: Ig-like domain-containing protein, partial [Candidatus Rokuibacteriota bacterium]